MFRLAGPGANSILRSTNTIKFSPANSPRRTSAIPRLWRICSPKSSPLLRPSSVTALTMASRFHALFWTTSPRSSGHSTAQGGSALSRWRYATKPTYSGHCPTRSSRLAADHGLQSAQLCRACDATLQAHFRQHHEGASAAAAENRGMDQCVCTEQNDKSRYAGVRESLESSETRAALLKFFFIPLMPI